MSRSTRWLLALVMPLLASSGAWALEVDCRNGLDDDGDTVADCADADCGCATAMRDFSGDPGYISIFTYFFSLPEDAWPGDVADSRVEENMCVGPGGPASGDGVIDSSDILCLIHGGTMDSATIVARWNPLTCSFDQRGVGHDSFSGWYTLGSPFPLSPDEGYMVTVSPGSGLNRTMLAGWNDPAWPGTTIAPVASCYPALQILHIPFDGLYRRTDEILCGQEGVAWSRGPDGDPETCPQGIFDGTTPISVWTLDNDPSDAPTGDAGTNNQFVARSVLMTDMGLQFLGVDFEIRAGDAVVVQLCDGHQPTLFLPPRS